MKERALAYFYRDMSAAAFDELGRRYAEERLPRLVRPVAAERIAWHLTIGHRVVVVTASLAAWIEPWCRANGLEIIATRPEIKDGRLTGRLDGKSCVNEEKRHRVLAAYDPAAYARVYAYGDTSEDLAMLSLAQERWFEWKQVG
jgi:HAD superfamily hydrolase (TIGR01490 family)